MPDPLPSPSPVPLPVPAPAPELPAGLTVEEAIQIAEAIDATYAESTRAVYTCMWSQWERWCQARGAAPIPAAPAMICAYLTERAASGVAVGTLDMDCGAISCAHRRHGLEDPILTEGVRQVRRGLRARPGAQGHSHCPRTDDRAPDHQRSGP